MALHISSAWLKRPSTAESDEGLSRSGAQLTIKAGQFLCDLLNLAGALPGNTKMTAMKGDIVNRVRRLPKPTKPSEALQPLFRSVAVAGPSANAEYAVSGGDLEADGVKP
jgi:hypothetical protein